MRPTPMRTTGLPCTLAEQAFEEITETRATGTAIAEHFLEIEALPTTVSTAPEIRRRTELFTLSLIHI